MDITTLQQVRNCCRDEAAFEQLQKILTIANQSFSIERQNALFRVITKIRESLDLDAIFNTTALEVRQLLNADRVGIFKFYPNSGWSDGEFVSEDVVSGLHSALDTPVHDHCFGEKHAIHYQNGTIQAVSDIYNAGLQDCHIDILRRFQIRANLVVPLLQDNHLWGLLCIHQCASPREWKPDEIEFVRHVATHLSIAVQQSELLKQTQCQSLELTQALKALKKSQTQLIQREKLSSLGQLVAGIAHEINNPVNFIYGNLTHASQYAHHLLDLLARYQQELLSPSPELTDRIAEIDLTFLMDDFPKILSSMQMGADRIRQIVLSLHNFSRIDEADMKPVNIHDGIDSTLLILQHRLKSSPNSAGIKVVKEYGELPLVECYASQLNQVFMNIISNAIDALEETEAIADHTEEPHHQITIRTGIIPDQENIPRAIIRIADNGAGIPPTVQERLFEPFFTTKPAGKGTGLGLPISQQIVVERHGGAIECYSQPHEGTEFWIEIPIRPIQPQTETALSCTIEA